MRSPSDLTHGSYPAVESALKALSRGMAARESFPAHQPDLLNVISVAVFPRLRALAWRGDLLYASRGSSLLRARMKASSDAIEWQPLARYAPAWWRNPSASSRLAFRLFVMVFMPSRRSRPDTWSRPCPARFLLLLPGKAEAVSPRAARHAASAHDRYAG
jgi:hypothetical protein